MNNSEDIKLSVFIISLMFLFCITILMTIALAAGAQRIGVALLWGGVIASFAFNLITGFLGGKGGSIQDK